MYRPIKTCCFVAALAAVCLIRPLQAGPADDQYTVAAQHYSYQRWQLAADEFAVFLRDYPQDARFETVRFFLGESLVQLGRYDEARTHFATLLNRDPTHQYALQAQFRLGEAAYLSGQLVDGRVELELFRQRYADSPLNAYAMVYLGEIALSENDLAAAHNWFSQSLQQFPDGPTLADARLGMAKTLQRQQDLEAAERFFRITIESSGNRLADLAAVELAALLHDSGRHADVLTLLESFAKNYPDSPHRARAEYWQAMSHFATGNYAEAARVFTLLSGQNKLDADLAPFIRFQAAESHRQLDQRDQASAQYGQVLEGWPSHDKADDALLALMHLSWTSQDWETLARRSQQFAEQYPHSPLLSEASRLLGRSYLRQERFVDAEQVFAKLAGGAATAKSTRITVRISDDPVDPPRDESQPSVSPADHYYLAIALIGQQRHEEALAALERAAVGSQSDDQLPAAIAVARAACLVSLERHADAIPLLESYLNDHADAADASRVRAQLAVALAHTKELERAERVFDALRNDPSATSLLLPTAQFLAEKAYAQQHRAMAGRMFQFLAQEGHPEQYRAAGLSGLAWLDWRESNAASAEKFHRLLRDYPESPLAAEAAMMRGRGFEKEGQPEAALAMYHLIVDRYPQSGQVPAALFAAARIHDRLHQDNDSRQLLQQLLDKHPQFEQRDAALYQMAWVLEDLDRSVEADQYFSELHRQHPSSSFWADATYRLAERAARQDNVALAGELAGQLISAAGTDDNIRCHALYLTGQLAAKTQRWSEVPAAMQKIIDGYPSHALRLPAHYWLAEARYRLADYADAETLFDELDRQTKGRSEPWLATVALRRAQVAAQQDRWSEARKLVLAARERFPDFDRQYEIDYLLGRCFASQGLFDQARESYQLAIRGHGAAGTETAAMAEWMVGETYFQQKDFPAAIRTYHRVESLHAFPQWQAAALLQAGKCHEMLGQWQDALQLYDQLLSEYPDTTFDEEARRRRQVAEQRANLVGHR